MGGAALGGPVTAAPVPRGAGGRRVAPVRPGSIGILGGTFDPFHVGHLALARAARDQLGLERVLVVPAAVPPHKLGRPISPRRRPAGPRRGRDRRRAAARGEPDRARPAGAVLDGRHGRGAGGDRASGRPRARPDRHPVGRVVRRPAELARAGAAARPRPGRGRAAGRPSGARPGRDRRRVSRPRRADRRHRRAAASTCPRPTIRRRAAAGESLDGLVPPAVAEVIAADAAVSSPRTPGG